MPLLIEAADDDDSVSGTWGVGSDGTLCHNPTGVRVSADRGVEAGGRVYRLSAKDIDLDRNNTLGAGSSGVVQGGVHVPTGMRVAVKTVQVDSKGKREQMLNEIQGLIQAEGCKNLVQWYAGFIGRDTGLVHIVVEFMDLGSFADMRRRLGGDGERGIASSVPPRHLSCIAAQILRGLQHLQARRILHRDVKPENILHSRAGQVKLTDFGISKELNSTVGAAATFVGTANYMAPERALGKDYSYPSDVWSVGMVIYELAAGRYPFETKGFLDLYDCLCVQPEPRLDEANFPLDLCSVVESCLTRDVMKRLDANALLALDLLRRQGDPEVLSLSEWLKMLKSD